MSTAAALALYSVLILIASLAGGMLPFLVRLTHRRMQIAISFVSGMILGIGLLHLLPHGFFALGSIDTAMLWLLGGFLFMFFLERFLDFHHHDVQDDTSPRGDDLCVADHDHDAHHEPPRSLGTSELVAAGLGLSLHALVDGVAVVAAVQADAAEHATWWLGIGTALAIMLHKPFDALTIGALAATARLGNRARFTINVLYSLVTPLGILACALVAHQALLDERALGYALSFAAGAFVCIATSDLLPELQFHRHDRLGLSLALVAGIALAWSTIFLEPGHHESHEQHSHHEHEEGK